ncbi:MAG: TolC family protein [Parabacteroides sp.]|uniref:TolC family protein n=2 Tax=Bacteria TaxID=2 RepID=A0ABT0C5L2_9BACT|nr:TolC family protein [Parabacteroides faecalis]MCI7286904.1 TolC family protein [Parabacteroides sp.]MDY6256029.1 TolC family protein [Bacteroidales bacterium]HIX22153.1 TolC family protein [Candidatus Parabacteroides faecavium]MCJ2382284.1 TolC family protein [Parabacteroides faecalis]MDD6951995.1 TolC family protein [Parabacteroides sp.]
MRKSVLCGVLLLLFGKMVSAQQTLSLQECRDLAVKNNKELRIAEEKIRMADYEKKAALTKYFPQISANGAYMWNQKDLNLLDMGQLSSSLASSLGGLAQLPVVQQTVGAINDLQHLDIQNVWVGNVALVQPVFMGGKIVTYNQITAYAKELAMSMNDQKLQDLLYKTDETYWQVVSLVNKKKLADAYVELLRKTDEDMAALIAEGVATQADGLSVKVKLNEAEMAQTKVNNGLALSRMLLAQLCGLPLTDTLTLADEQLDNFPVEERTTSVDVNQAFMNRNELKSLDLASKIYKKKERIVLADLLPTVAFSANYFVTNPNLFNGFKNDFAGMFNLGVIVRVPITGWWEGSYKRNAARAETRIRQLEWEDAREKIELQVNQSVYKVNEASKKLAASNRNMENAEENLRSANLGFEEGVIPALNLMAAQTAWFSARSTLIDAQIDMKLTQVYLNKALGVDLQENK